MASIIFTNLWRRASRTLFTAAGIAVGVATIVALLGFTQGLKETAAGFVHLGGSDLGVFQANVSDPTASVLPESMVDRLAARPYVARATPLQLVVEAIPGEAAAMTFGAEPSGFFAKGLVLVAGSRPTAWAQEALIGDRLAAQLHLTPGASLTIKGRRYRIAGTYHSGILFEDAGVVLSLAQARQLTGRRAEQTSVTVDIAPGDARASSLTRSNATSPARR
jgi:putative ABC transport system permease protein